MTVTEAVTASGITPSADYKGIENTDDFVLAICTEASKKDAVKDWTVCADHVREHTGPVTTKGSVQRTLAMNGDRCKGDAFQDFILGHEMIYGSGQSVILPYIYFSLRTGKGEKGEAAFIVTSDVGGSAGAIATFACDVKGIGTPAEFDYSTVAAG